MSIPFQFGLVGHNIQYSLSPRIFDTIGALQKQPIQYELFDVSPDGLPDLVDTLRSGSLNGLSVTVPYKETMVAYCDRLTVPARDLGAINSIWFGNNAIVGDNTDIVGIERSLRPHAESLAGGEAMIVGNGGAALAVAYVLTRQFGIHRLCIVGRSPGKLESFCARVRSFATEAEIHSLPFSSDRIESPTIPSVVINCTPLGGFNESQSVLFADDAKLSSLALYFDLNYNQDNKNVVIARERGAIAINGRIMLVVQAVESYKRWTGQSPDPQTVYAAVFGVDTSF